MLDRHHRLGRSAARMHGASRVAICTYTGETRAVRVKAGLGAGRQEAGAA
jgi:hypothetical protein